MKYVVIGFGLLLASHPGIGATLKGVDVFVTRAQHELVVGCNEDCRIWDIDATDRLLDDFFGELPSDEQEAYVIVQEKLASKAWQAIEQSIITAQQSVITAFELGVKKYPAIVFNGEKVVYGLTDVTLAKEDALREDE